MATRVSIAWLVAANLLPIFGVLFLDWSVFAILFLFWCENVVIGLFGVARTAMSTARLAKAGGAFLAVFFLIHYGGFMMGHLMVLIGLFGGDDAHLLGGDDSVGAFLGLFDTWTIIAIIALVLSHGWSFFANYLGQREYESLSGMGAMALPYKRMMITHVALIAGGFLLTRWDEPIVGLLVLVGMKIALDVTFHRREHVKLGTQQFKRG